MKLDREISKDSYENLSKISIFEKADRAQNIVETLVIVDKEFGELFDFDYQKIADYLTVYFWDINSRYKSLWSVDISLKVIDLMIIKVTSNTKTVHGIKKNFQNFHCLSRNVINRLWKMQGMLTVLLTTKRYSICSAHGCIKTVTN